MLCAAAPTAYSPALVASCRECRHQGSASAAATGSRRRDKDRSWGVVQSVSSWLSAVRRRWRCRERRYRPRSPSRTTARLPRGRMVPALRVEHREWPGPCSDGDESIATVAVRADDALPDNIAADKNTELRHSTHQPQSGTPRRYLADDACGLCLHRPRSRRSEPSNGI
jgi:hypothetical protein